MSQVLSNLDININREGLFAKRRKFVEVRVPSTGQIEIFDTRTKNIERALKSSLAFVKAVEEKHGEIVYWRFRGENTFHIGSNFDICSTPKDKLKYYGQSLLGYFFDVD